MSRVLRIIMFAGLILTGQIVTGTWASAQQFLMPDRACIEPEVNDKKTETDNTGIFDLAKCECEEAECKGWLGTLPIRGLPRPGDFPVPPTGCGYYSVVDWLHHCPTERPNFPYSPFSLMVNSFFDSDFRYLDSPKNKQSHFSDAWHFRNLNENWLFSTGGEIRWRHHNENNSRLSGRTNDYDLFRTRVYGDLWYKNSFRMFAEFIYAENFGSELNPLPIDINRSDLLNAFLDVKVGGTTEAPWFVRVGRQELLRGSQRFISPLDWANTRRTFQGVSAFRAGKKWDLDLFWVQPVIPNRNNFDSVDNDQNFAGAWYSYRPKKGDFVDAYYLFLDNTTPFPRIGDPGPVGFNVHTIGGRYAGSKEQFLWDFEAAMQFGSRGNDTIVAGAATASCGYNFKNLPMNPTFWVCYDYASGDEGGSTFSTFNQLFPFGHFYLGWLDLVGRQNIHDINCHLFLYPTNFMTVWCQYHHFELASATDALYNAGGVAIRRDVTGAAGTNVGDELDFIVNFHLSTHSDLLISYTRIFAGDFLVNTGSSNFADALYIQYSYRW